MKKNITLIFFSSIFAFAFIYLLVFSWVFIFEKYKDENNFPNIESLNFHKKYSNQIHHLRANNWFKDKKYGIWKNEDYLFSSISDFRDKSDNFLIQGDSWAEYMIFKDKIYKGLLEEVTNRDIGLINGGTSSFSPSLMKVQYEILERQYKIKPDFVISIIDQTDIGDELCRYKHNIIENDNGTVQSIRREINTGAVMDISKHYNFSKILLEKKKFINFHITNYYFYKTFHEMKTRILNIKKFGFKNGGNYKCVFQQIQKYLININNQEKEYFKKRTQEYLDYLVSKEYLKKIFIVTFPHKNHFGRYYKINVSNIINELNLSSKIIHIDFNEIIENNQFKKENIYELNDPASHLNQETHVLYIKKIFKIIREKKY